MTASRIRITDLIDADAGSPRYCGHSIGRVIKIPPPIDGGTRHHLRIDRIERCGENVYGIGTLVSAAQAEKLQTRWDIRWGFRCAPQPKPDTPAYRAGGSGRTTRFSDVDSAAAAIVNTGYRELAKRNHPDVGGSSATMTLLSQAKTQLSQILDLAKGTK